MAAAAERVDPVRWLPSFVALSAIWGSSFALIKVGVDAGVAPLWVALWRCLFGALALLAVCAVQRAVIATLWNAVPFALFAYGEQHISSLLAGLVNATTPLTTLVFLLALVPQERAMARRLIGLLLGLLGVFCVFGAWRGIAGGTVASGLACLGATTGYGAAFRLYPALLLRQGRLGSGPVRGADQLCRSRARAGDPTCQRVTDLARVPRSGCIGAARGGRHRVRLCSVALGRRDREPGVRGAHVDRDQPVSNQVLPRPSCRQRHGRAVGRGR